MVGFASTSTQTTRSEAKMFVVAATLKDLKPRIVADASVLECKVDFSVKPTRCDGLDESEIKRCEELWEKWLQKWIEPAQPVKPTTGSGDTGIQRRRSTRQRHQKDQRQKKQQRAPPAGRRRKQEVAEISSDSESATSCDDDDIAVYLSRSNKKSKSPNNGRATKKQKVSSRKKQRKFASKDIPNSFPSTQAPGIARAPVSHAGTSACTGNCAVTQALLKETRAQLDSLREQHTTLLGKYEQALRERVESLEKVHALKDDRININNDHQSKNQARLDEHQRSMFEMMTGTLKEIMKRE